MRVSVIGARGQYGSEIVREFKRNSTVTEITTNEVDVSDAASCNMLKKSEPEVIVNSAAFFPAERCEGDPGMSFRVNATGAMNVANVSSDMGAIDVYLSTDFVFDGKKNSPYKEDDDARPLNTYGISKLAGELYTMRTARHYVIRSASMFGVSGTRSKSGGNFVDSMLEKAAKGERIEMVDDISMSPTYAKHAAMALHRLVEIGAPYGVYHIANDGGCTWYDFTRKIFEIKGIDADLHPIKSGDQGSRLQRPRFTVLDNGKLRGLGIEMAPWHEALAEYMVEKGHIKG